MPNRKSDKPNRELKKIMKFLIRDRHLITEKYIRNDPPPDIDWLQSRDPEAFWFNIEFLYQAALCKKKYKKLEIEKDLLKFHESHLQ